MEIQLFYSGVVTLKKYNYSLKAINMFNILK